MSSFWNPFRPNKYYFERSLSEFVEEFIEFLIGSGGLGFFDYLFLVPLIFKCLLEFELITRKSFLYYSLNLIEFLFLALKIIISAPITFVFIPFLFAYNEIALFIGKPIKKLFEKMEVLAFKKYRLGSAEEYNLLVLDKSANPQNYEELEALLPKNCGNHTLALFNDASLYYIDKKLKTMQKIDPNSRDSNILILNLKNDPITFNTVNSGDFLYREIQRVISPIHREDYSSLDFDIFYNTYYEENTEKTTLLTDCHHLTYKDLVIKPMFVNIPPNSKRMILGLFDNLFAKELPHSFIVPSKNNKKTLKPLLDKKLLNFIDMQPGYLENLYKLLDEDDPFLSKKLIEKEQRIDTTVILMKKLCPNPKARKQKGSEGFDLSKIITNYAGIPNLTTADKAEVEKRLDQDEYITAHP